MGATASLEPRTLPVDPGAEATLVVTIRNTGSVVDEYAIEGLGDTASWMTADPPTLSLFPGAQGTARITFGPPRSASTKAGPTPFAVMVRSHEDPNGSTVEEGTLQVGAFLAPSAELVPRTSHGSRSGHHDLALDNRGNTAVAAALSGSDPDGLVRFAIDPPTLPVDPGTAGFAKVAVKPVRTFWRGPAKTRPFQLAIQPDAPGAAPVVLDGSYLQESILPPWFVRAVMALIALIVALVLLWLLVLQPQIKATAAQALADAGYTARPGSPGGGGGGTGGGSPSPLASSVVTLTPPPAGQQALVDGRLDTTTNALTPTAGTLFITDLVFSNPTGASGDLTLQRNPVSGAPTKLLVLRLDNFRDYDVHFVTPITVHAGETLALVANCAATGSGGGAAPACEPAVFYSGYVTSGG
ncbi:MAG TPA: hypothetical protein VKR30_02670 [Candidatus Limnocylindrales bacterium]|nr:hypothetical protein [Candidatus Limnocylindrales bacterium]